MQTHSADSLVLSHLFGTTVRIAFHDSGEVDINTSDLYGPDGCLSTDTNISNGMTEADSPILTILEPIWQDNCDLISRGDFWALFAKKIVEYSDNTSTIHINYQYGRKNNVGGCDGGSGRLPNAQLGTFANHQTFVKQMGLTANDSGNYIELMLLTFWCFIFSL